MEIENSLNVSRETIEKLEIFSRILLDWNQRFNLISKSSEANLWQRHIIDSLQVIQYLKPQDRILDIGSGAGFPGIILAIAGFQEIKLVESLKKKCLFLEFVKKELSLNCEIINERIENISHSPGMILTARAFAPLEKLLAIFQFTKASKALFMKGGSYLQEIEVAEKIWLFRYEAYRSLTSPESAIIEIQNLKKWK